MCRLLWAVCHYAVLVALYLAMGPVVLAADNIVARYDYDALGRLIAVVTADGRVAKYVYDEAGNIRAVQRPSPAMTVINAMTPSSGREGSVVKITGAGFNSDASKNVVNFGSRVASVVSATSNELHVIVPTGSTTSQVSVVAQTSQGGRNTAVSDTLFTVLVAPAPMIFGFSPLMAVAGSPVKISGANFEQPAKIYFNGVAGFSTTVGATMLSASVPAMASSGKIKVSTRQGSSVSAQDFIVLPPPYQQADIGNTGRLSTGAPSLVPFTSAGKTAILLFDGVAGQRISLVAESDSLLLGDTLIFGPGNVILGTGYASEDQRSSFVDVLTLPATGTYAAYIKASGTSTGDATVMLHDVADIVDMIVPGGMAKALKTTMPGQNASLVFDAKAGQRISIRTACASRTRFLNIALLKPDGTALMQFVNSAARNAFQDVQVLPVDGRYTIHIDPGEALLADVTVQVYSVPADATASAVIGGATATVATTIPGQNAQLFFQGQAGQSVRVRILDFNFGYPKRLELHNPDGSVLPLRTESWAAGDYYDLPTLPAAGIYHIAFDPYRDNLGIATMQLLDVPVGVVGDIQTAATVDGSPVRLATFAPGQNGRMEFDAIAGQQVGIRVSDIKLSRSGLAAPQVSLLAPDGSLLISPIAIGENTELFVSQLLAVSGRYTIKLDPPDEAVVQAVFQVAGHLSSGQFYIPVSETLSAVVISTPMLPSTGQPVLTFEGKAGYYASLHIETLGGSRRFTAALLRPDGTLQGEISLKDESWGGLEIEALPATGPFLLRFTGLSGVISVRLILAPPES